MESDRPITPELAEELLGAVAQQLGLLRARYEIVVVGGTALAVLGLVRRATRDVDVVAIRDQGSLIPAEPLPELLMEAARRVASDYGLPENWLNAGPADIARIGLPKGFEERMVTREYSPSLVVDFAGRLDLIHFKLYAAADPLDPERHEADLLALEPTQEELLSAARWARTQDPSEPFRDILLSTLERLGVSDADLD